MKDDARSDSTDKTLRAAAAPLTIRGAVATGTVLAVDAGELVVAEVEKRSTESSEDAIGTRTQRGKNRYQASALMADNLHLTRNPTKGMPSRIQIT